MAAKTHIRAETTTRLAAKVNETVDRIRRSYEDLNYLVDVMGQITLDGNLAEKLGLENPEDAEAVKAVLTSARNQMRDAEFVQQTISRFG